ncbi:transmembrane and coiled-coil domain-containing protein 4 [Elysia marginata]|uniref:Transmembrane and coiled-coil domain-containing protein 4 n=1 Tax=Elysia marginata TaxID=1093978 RepID=A0AAV4F076_9GAST|nr:transmembrane and coiled-coil domain-containing protein 4 [Elysia marginata]
METRIYDAYWWGPGGDFRAKNNLFDNLISGDETWVHLNTPETKHDSMTWKHPSSPVTKKVKVQRSAAKVMAIVFLDAKGLLAAVAWPATLLGASNIIDNPWSVAMERSQSTGRLLADVLLSRDQGNRPVSLIGFSLGARVIFYCLEELSKRKGCEGIVEDVIILGAPVTGDVKTWAKFDRVVAGKIVNGYCRGDWLLKFLYRTAHVKLNVAGLGPIMWENRRMYNLDLSSVVEGHLDYQNKLNTIMKAVGLRTRDEVSRSSSNLKVSASSSASQLFGSLGRRDHEPSSTSMDDLSSSDDEMHEPPRRSRQVYDCNTPGQPVVLEDYTSCTLASGQGEGDGAAGRKTSESGSSTGGQRSGSEQRDPNREDPPLDRTVIPESASFDSGVEVNRAESETKEGVEAPRPMVTESAPGLKYTEAVAKCDSAEPSHRLDCVGDASANSEGPVGGEEEKLEQKDEESTSSLQRKKMFDSMYRLVLDDDLLEVMNEEGVDDDALLAEKDYDGDRS